MESQKKVIDEAIMPTGGEFGDFRYSMFTEKREQKELNNQISEFAKEVNKQQRVEQKKS